MSGATGFKRPRQRTMGNAKSTAEQIMAVDALLDEPHPPPPTPAPSQLNQSTQDIPFDDDDIIDSLDEETELELSEILQAEAQQWLSEFGEKLFKLTVHQWLVKKDRQQQKKTAPPKTRLLKKPKL